MERPIMGSKLVKAGQDHLGTERPLVGSQLGAAGQEHLELEPPLMGSQLGAAGEDHLGTERPLVGSQLGTSGQEHLELEPPLMGPELGAAGQDHLGTDRPLMGSELGAASQEQLELERSLMGPNASNNKSDDQWEEEWLHIKGLENLNLKEEVCLFPSSDCHADENKSYIPVTKVVVRRLPPRFTAKDYLRELPEVPSYNYIRRVKPVDDLPQNIQRTSGIFINFKKEDDAFWFKEKYDKMEFFDHHGNRYTSCIDYAFVQEVLKNAPIEPEMGTLEETEMYRRFLRTYHEDPRSLTRMRFSEIPVPETRIKEIKYRKRTGGCLGQKNTPLGDFFRQQAKLEAENNRKIKEIEDFRRMQRGDILKRRQEEEETTKYKERLMKPKDLSESETKDDGQYRHKCGCRGEGDQAYMGKDDKPSQHQGVGELAKKRDGKCGQAGTSTGKKISARPKSSFTATRRGDKELRQRFKKIGAKVKRAKQLEKVTNDLRKSKDNWTTVMLSNNNGSNNNSGEMLEPLWEKLSEDSDQSSNSSHESFETVKTAIFL